MEALNQPTPWLHAPRIETTAEHRVIFAKGYNQYCFALQELNRDTTRPRFEDLRLYPLTDAGRDAAADDLNAIEEAKRLRERERLRDIVRDGIQRRQCRYCRYYPVEKTRLDGIGRYLLCNRPDDATDAIERIIYGNGESCKGFAVSDKYKNF